MNELEKQHLVEVIGLQTSLIDRQANMLTAIYRDVRMLRKRVARLEADLNMHLEGHQ